MNALGETACCGVNEITSLGDFRNSKDALQEVCRDMYWYEGNCAFITFTQAGSGTRYGNNLKRYIESNKLGDVTVSPSKVNPNTGNRVRMFVWAINRPALDRWAYKNGVDRENSEDNDDYDPYNW
jgi:hypothetical protein